MALSFLSHSARWCRVYRCAVQSYGTVKWGKHDVSSPAMKQLDRQCEAYPPPPPPRPPLVQKVTILGAASPVGLMTALFLKQQELIHYLALYDDCNIIGPAHDLAHIDTCTAVEAYKGRVCLKDALENAAVVLICCGCQSRPRSDGALIDVKEFFLQNARVINSLIIAVGEFCPHAIICLQTPPVDCTFAFCRSILKKHKTYDKRRLLGLNALAAMRANKLYCDLEKHDPTTSYCPCVCGTFGRTVVPVFSTMKRFECQKNEDIDNITKLVRGADQLVVDLNCCCNCFTPHLSTGFSTARFVSNVMKGICEEKNGFLDSALVEQDDPKSCYGMKYCATPLSIGKDGVTEYIIPTLNAKEKELLRTSKKELEHFMNIGSCHFKGDDYRQQESENTKGQKEKAS